MTPAALTLTAAAALLLLASTSTSRASVEQGEGDSLPSISFDTLTDRIESTMNQLTEQAADVPQDVAGANIAAFLEMIYKAEGTANAPDPYRVCYGYRHTISDMSDHPAVTGEWRGERLPDAMCANAGFGPGCVSTAAGAGQIIKPTWINIKAALNLPDFGPESQRAAHVELIRRRGALEDVKAGRLESAVIKCRNEWASLPGNFAKQGQRSIETLAAWYQQNGGTFA
jgi:muramidase (phage lysozyme)